MFRLLSIEFHKLKYNKASRVLSIIYFGLLTCIALIAAIRFDFAGFRFDITTTGVFNFPYIWHFNSWVASTIKFFLLLVIVSMTANEYSYKTLKQNLIDGMSKQEVILSKFYTVIVFAAISTLFVFLVSFVLGLLYSDFNEMSIIFSGLEYLFAFFIKLVGYFSFGLFAGMLVKRSAFAVGAMVVWWFVEGLVKVVIAISLGTSGKEHLITQTINKVTRYLPFEAMSNLIKEPFSKLGAVKTVASQLGEGFVKDHSVQFLDVLIVLAWTFIFIYASYALLKRRDL